LVALLILELILQDCWSTMMLLYCHVLSAICCQTP